MKKNIIVFVLVFVLAGVAVYQNISAKERTAVVPTEVAPKLGFLAPSFKLDALDGKTYEVGGPRDKPLLINFWASWCGPCEVEAPDLVKMYNKYHDQFDLYAVNITKNDFLSDVKDMVKQYQFPFPVLLDKEASATQMYNFQVVPTSFLIDKNGAIVDVFHVLEPRELEKKIKNVIEKQ
jgi:thiol-disulfide isomerase/thioredoxin